MLKTVVTLNIFEETVIHFFQDSLINKRTKEQHLFGILFRIINVLTVTFDQLNASLLNKSINFF